ncbi:MAG: hypothetical protein M1818_007509 [Claussenomyces sp. TS43310]|nr:MAG: hypothetical protein M1818_007509 [Claussenomyces sp. TS43310]
MTRNIYDEDDFFKGYIQLPRQVIGLSGSPEWPDLRAMIPGLKGAKLLDLGCGFGWVCRWAREQGAEEAKGVDLSENMLAKATEFPQDDAISYTRANLETLELSPSTYQVVFSSLAFHYLENLPGLVAQVYRSLTPGGTLVFAVEHPIFTAPRTPDFIEDAEGRVIWPLDGYLREGPRVTSWFTDGVVKQHRTISTYITILLEAGFVLSAINEWGPNEEQIKEFPEWARIRERPPFLLVKATKPL